MLLLLSAIFGAIAIFICFQLIAIFNYHKPLSKYPKPRILPLFRATIQVHRTKNALPIVLEWMKSIGTIIKFHIFGITPCVLMITNVNFIERLLGGNKILAKAQNYSFLARWLGDGLLTSTGEQWKSRRKLLTPAFHFEILEQFTDVFDYNGQILVEKLKSEVGRDSIDIYPLITLCTLDIICETAMGTSINAQTNSESEYVQSVRELCSIIRNRSVSPFKIHKRIYECSWDYQNELKALEVIHSFTNRVIRERKATLNLNKEDLFVPVDEFGRKRKETLLDLLLRSQIRGQNITDKEINEEVNTFLFEGHDTVSSAVSFALYSIANHLDVQEKVIDELQTIFANDFDRNATYQDLISMKYLEAVIKETLRLYPSVPIYGRCVKGGIDFDDTHFPHNLNLFVCPYAVHRQADIYPNPEKFDPQRFLDDNINIPLYAYIPFSAGPRNCIGQKFAMLEMKSLIAKLLRQFELLPAIPEHKLEPYPDIVLKSKTGMCIKLKQREL